MTPSEQSYREIPLTRGLSAKVDAADYEWLSQWKWCVIKTSTAYYAVRSVWHKVDKRYYFLLMHRVIMGLEREDKRVVDHIETGNTLDNRRSNLRIATRSQNNCNSRKRRNNSSGYKGVSFHKQSGKWIALIGMDGKDIFLGSYSTPEEAYAVYCEATKKYHGEFARP